MTRKIAGFLVFGMIVAILVSLATIDAYENFGGAQIATTDAEIPTTAE